MQAPVHQNAAIKLYFTGLVFATAAAAATRLWNILRVDDLTWLETDFLVLFTVLFAWNAASFWFCCIGAYAKPRNLSQNSLIWPSDDDASLRSSRARTAIVMPICNEDAARLFAGIAAIRESIAATGAGDKFDIVLLSNSQKPDCRAAEEARFKALLAETREGAPAIYYRNRIENIGRKSGNIAEFCVNWGGAYEYMIVLDADSVMTGDTSVALVRLMDTNPRAAVIQVPPLILGRESLFARVQQFAASVYGPLHAWGFALVHDTDGNYWGHNAIIRVRPFMQHCGLPELGGPAPLGGEILSHDFVEAALLRRAGWELYLVPQLEGSYEEPPPTLLDYLKRDRRWCQGNLQHARLVFAQGFHFSSRMHLLSGVMSYLSSPLWLLMLIVSALDCYFQSPQAVTYVGRYPVLVWAVPHGSEIAVLIGAMLVLLYGPKLIALAVLLRDRDAVAAHGGALNASLSVALESVLSTLLAPITMLSHCGFVASILLGQSTGWHAQKRTDYKMPLFRVLAAFLPHTAVAIGAGIALRIFLPDTFWWFLPLLIGAVLAIPLAWATSSLAIGRWTRARGLFLVPSETVGITIVRQIRAIEMMDAEKAAA